MPGIYLFDDGLASLAPLADLRAACDVRIGAWTARERLGRGVGARVRGVIAAAGLERLTPNAVAMPAAAHAGTAEADWGTIYVNARCPLLPDGVMDLGPGEAIVEAGEGPGRVIAANVDGVEAPDLVSGNWPGTTIRTVAAPALLSRPWHVRTFRDACVAYDLSVLTGTVPKFAGLPGVVHIGSDLHVSEDATVYPGAIFDSEHGAIVIDVHAVVRPGAQLIGPCYVGPHSTVLERATIRGQTAIGPWCKVNGEVGGTVFQGFANKAHDGYVGDSYIGEWVNLGAGTTTSNLLNTYGEVIAKASAKSSNERTGQQFLGATIGDHTKTAICSRLMTGVVIHTGAMIASTAAASGCVPPFAWVTDAGTRTYRLEKFLEVARAAMARRKVTPTEAYEARIAQLHAATM